MKLDLANIACTGSKWTCNVYSQAYANPRNGKAGILGPQLFNTPNTPIPCTIKTFQIIFNQITKVTGTECIACVTGLSFFSLKEIEVWKLDWSQKRKQWGVFLILLMPFLSLFTLVPLLRFYCISTTTTTTTKKKQKKKQLLCMLLNIFSSIQKKKMLNSFYYQIRNIWKICNACS